MNTFVSPSRAAFRVEANTSLPPGENVGNPSYVSLNVICSTGAAAKEPHGGDALHAPLVIVYRRGPSTRRSSAQMSRSDSAM